MAAIGAAICTGSGAASLPVAETQPAATDNDPIIVTGYRLPDGLDGAQLIDQVGVGDIAGYGDDSLADLLADMDREDDAAGEDSRPLILLNGKRVFNLSQIADLPTESVRRVEVFAAPAALRFGGSSTQKVMNFVLRNRYRSEKASAGGGFATEGGGQRADAGLSMTRVDGDNRSTVGAMASGARRLLESERGIHSRVTGFDAILDQGRFRTLAPEQRRYALNGTIARRLGAASLSVNAGGTFDRGRSLFGLPELDGVVIDDRPLEQEVRNLGGYVTVEANQDVGRWSLSGTGEYGYRDARSVTDRSRAASADIVTDRARATTNTGGLVAVVSGPLVDAPAGPIRVSVRGDLTRSLLDDRLAGTGPAGSSHLARTDAGTWVDVELPIARRKDGSRGLPGGLSAHLNAGIRSVSGVRTLHSLGATLSWVPREGVIVAASLKEDRQPPSLVQLGAPVIATSNVPYFDYVRGETVEVTHLSGGNPELDADRRKTLTISASAVPFGPGVLRIGADYKRSRIEGPIASLPAGTADIQAAFPERFVRDSDGALVAVDDRLVNFARERREQLHWGFLLRHSLEENGGEPGDGDDGNGIRLSFDHTWYLTDEVQLRPGLPELDLLHGDPKGEYGGQPRHLLQWELGAFWHGMGARLSGSWHSGTHVHGGADTAADGLRFSTLMQNELRLFTDLGDRLPGEYWARDLRVSLTADNLLNQRQKVRDANGDTPFRFRPGYLDPFGRTVRLELRKIFD
jgi:hypothetical protein